MLKFNKLFSHISPLTSFKFQQSDLTEEERSEIRKKSEEATKEAANLKLPPKSDFCVREWVPYNDYAVPDVLDAVGLHWGVPTVQRLWFR